MSVYLTLAAALTGALIWLLYRQGLAAAKCIAAVLFVFRPGKQSDSVSVDSCTGWVRHAGRFRQGGGHQFYLDCRLSKGRAVVTLLDRQKGELLRLSQDSPAGEIELSRNVRYCLRWEFQNATGKCELRWQASQ